MQGGRSRAGHLCYAWWSHKQRWTWCPSEERRSPWLGKKCSWVLRWNGRICWSSAFRISYRGFWVREGFIRIIWGLGLDRTFRAWGGFTGKGWVLGKITWWGHRRILGGSMTALYPSIFTGLTVISSYVPSVADDRYSSFPDWVWTATAWRWSNRTSERIPQPHTASPHSYISSLIVSWSRWYTWCWTWERRSISWSLRGLRPRRSLLVIWRRSAGWVGWCGGWFRAWGSCGAWSFKEGGSFRIIRWICRIGRYWWNFLPVFMSLSVITLPF